MGKVRFSQEMIGSPKTSKAKIVLEGDKLLGGGKAEYCFDTKGTRDRFYIALVWERLLCAILYYKPSIYQQARGRHRES